MTGRRFLSSRDRDPSRRRNPSWRDAWPVVPLLVLWLFGSGPLPHLAAQPAGSANSASQPMPQTDIDVELLDELAFSAGLLGEYRAGQRAVRRIDPDLAFNWGPDMPSVALPVNEPFRATWSGRVLIRQACPHQLHVHVQGRVRVFLDGRPLIDAERLEPGWVSCEPVELTFGELPLRVEFEKTGPEAQIQLCWSSDVFALEPVPAHLLFLDQEQPELDVAQLQQDETGRLELERLRCFRCHLRSVDTEKPRHATGGLGSRAAGEFGELPALPGPDLSQIGKGTSTEWLVEKLTSPGLEDESSCMPDFGFSRSDATAVVAYLQSLAHDVALQAPKANESAAEERQQGMTLLHSLGCLACHRVGTLGQSGAFGGGDLTAIGRKRTLEWLSVWLQEPARLNRDHRMPVFDLSSRDRRRLSAALASLGHHTSEAAGGRIETVAARGDLARGQQLVRAARCAACHRIPNEPPVAPFATALEPGLDWKRGCTPAGAESTDADAAQAAPPSSVAPDPAVRQPHYPRARVEALYGYVETLTPAAAPLSEFDWGRSVLERRNCLACHERGLELGIKRIAGELAQADAELRGQSEGLIPPALTAVGDKFPDRALRAAVAGAQRPRRLPWLHARMPKFDHSADDHNALVAYLIGHDRIASGAPRGQIRPPADRDATLLAGHTLVGPRGLSCVACHRIGDYAPKNVALGTRGSDLLLLSEWMRPEYFLRWTRSPMRIVPGMEMPSYVKPVRGILDETIDTQLAAIWFALNDPRFTPPTNPTSVEQFITVEPGTPARIVRDVFTLAESDGGGYVPRAMAMGFSNGHSLLFDLDAFTIRHWCFGDMARQRTEGKSWFWDMAGLPVATGFKEQTDLRLVDAEGHSHLPALEESTRGRLVAYRQQALGVEVEYDLNFAAPQAATVRVVEQYRPIVPADSPSRETDERGTSGVERRIRVQGVPSAAEMSCVLQSITPAIRGARIEVRRPNGGWVALDDASATKPQVLRGGELIIRYLAAPAIPQLPPSKPLPARPAAAGLVTSVPGFEGRRLELSQSIMPTAMCWTESGTLAFTSLKGHVYLAHDRDGDGVEDALTVFEEGLAAPFGIIAEGSDLIVAHKPEVLRLRDTNGDGRADERVVVATGWGYSENYHDWTCGIVRDSRHRLYVGLGSDYAQPKRDPDRARWRGTVLRIDTEGEVEPIAYSLRYPVGMAINDSDDVFVSDNQGVQNTFNEINHVRDGLHFGVPSRYETDTDAQSMPPAVQVPHPWTRSVNGLCFLRGEGSASAESWAALAGQGIGCEYDSRFLIRFSLQRTGDTYQGAAYYFSDPAAGAGDANFLGPICAAFSPGGELYIGSIHDSGWLGGQNTGEIVRLRPRGALPNGIRQLRAHGNGFDLQFFAPVDRQRAARPENYQIQGYTRIWKGGYATPDSERHKVGVVQVDVSDDGRDVRLFVDRLREGFVYEVSCGKLAEAGLKLFPATGHYTMNRIPDIPEE